MNVTRGLRVAALALALSLAPFAAGAQSILINNYNRIPIGELGGVQGGAYLVRAADSSAGWYNPAGLVKAKRDSLSGNASLYEITRTEVGDEEPITNINNIANFVGGVGRMGEEGEPIKFVWGWSVAVPSQLKTSATRRFTSNNELTVQQNIGQFDEDGFEAPVFVTLDDLQTTTTATSSFTILAPGIAAGYEWNPDLRLGIGVRLYRVELTSQTGVTAFQDFESQQAAERAGEQTQYFNLVENQFQQGTANLLRLEGGVQYDMGSNISVGIVFRSPSIDLSSSGIVRLNSLQVYDSESNEDDDSVADTRFSQFVRVDDDNVEFQYFLPLQLGFGAAWISPSFELEFNVLYYGPVEKYDLFGGVDVFLQVNTHEVVNQDRNIPTEPTPYESDPVINYALGGTYKMSDASTLHFGGFTDFSPDAEGAEAFDRIDLFGLTLGASFFQKNTSTTFGFVYTFGQNPSATFQDPLTLATDQRNLRIQSLSVIAAGSVFF